MLLFKKINMFPMFIILCLKLSFINTNRDTNLLNNSQHESYNIYHSSYGYCTIKLTSAVLLKASICSS